MCNVRAAIIAGLTVVLIALLVPAVASAVEPDGKSGVTPNTIKLPSGPGSLDGIGQSFEPDLNSGTAVFNVPLEVPPGRAGHQPELNLTYNGGWGQSEVALGWRLSVPCVQRQTDKGLPSYAITNTLIYVEGGQELIALDDGTLRFKNEGAFTRFAWLGQGLEGQLRDGQKITFGQTADSRITTSAGIFMWCANTSTDTNGNVIEYHYFQDGDRPYLTDIRYNVATDGTAQTVSFSYQSRPDFVVDYQSRYPVSTALRLDRIEMRSRGQLVRAYQLAYYPDPSQSLLASVTRIGSDGVSALPPLVFSYTQFNPPAQPIVTMYPAPAVVPGGNVDLVMLDKDPLPDLIISNSGDHRYLLNLGRGEWATTPVRMTDPDTGFFSSPSAELSDNGVFLMDADGNGFADLVMAGSSSPFARFYPNRGRAFWEAPIDFTNNPSFSFESDNVRLSDQNFDKQVDVIATSPLHISCWLNQGDGLWSNQLDQPQPDPDQLLMFDNPQVKLADFNGDGLDDLGLVRSQSVGYYPGRGDCLFASRVDMLNSPDVGGYDLDWLRPADLNADGRTDLVYVDYSQVTYYLNEGNRWSDGIIIPNTPSLGAGVVLRFADMDASGTVDLLFADGQENRYQYLDFSGGIKPNLLARIDNSLGQIIDITYRSSTEYLIEARIAGQPWQNPMPLAVTVVSQVDVTDLNSGQVYTTSYVYRDGAWDGKEHEFRGFDWVDKIESGDASAPSTVSRYHFDTGLTDESRKGQILEQLSLGAGGTCSGVVAECYQHQINEVVTRTLAANSLGQQVRFAYVDQTDTYLYENTVTPRHLQKQYQYDDFGNVNQELDYGEVMTGSTIYGQDELLTYTDYAISTTGWLINLPATIAQTDGAGNLMSETRLHYDGAPHAGLPVGSVTSGNLTRREELLGPLDGNRFVNTQRYRYDAHGSVIEIQDANDHMRTIGYDPIFGTFPVRESILLGAGEALTMTAQYDLGFGTITSTSDFNGAVTLYQWDAFGRLSSIIRPGDSLAYPTQSISYTLSNPVSSVLVRTRERSGQALVRRQATYFDGLGRQLTVQQEAESGRVAVTGAVLFNQRQTPALRFYPYYLTGTLGYQAPSIESPAVELTYDPAGRVVQEQEPDGALRRVQYLPLSEVRFDEEDTRPDSSHFNTPTTFFYDGLTRLRGIQEIMGGTSLTTTYDYDPLGRLLQITDAQGNVTIQTWDGLGRKRTMLSPDAGLRSYWYDDVGNLTQTINARNQVVSYQYDAANRVTIEDYAGSLGQEIVYHYDHDRSPALPGAANTLGRLAYIEDQGGIEAYSYDARGNAVLRLRTIQGMSFTTSMQFDTSDRPLNLTFPDGKGLTYTYNPLGLIESIPGFVTNLDYWASGQAQEMALANGLTSHYTLDHRQRLQTLATTGYGHTYLSFTYEYDLKSNITHVADQRPDLTPTDDRTADYQYDDLYHLTQEQATVGTTDFAHDGISNIITQTSTVPDPRLNLGQILHGQNAGPHAPTTVGGDTYAYDETGNLISRPDLSLTFDYRDRLSTATTADGAVLTFLYDSNNIRLLKRIQHPDGSQSVTYYPDQNSEVRDGQTIDYVWVGAQRVAQIIMPVPPQNSIVRADPPLSTRDTYSHTVFLPVVFRNYHSMANGEVYFLLLDHLGSTQLVTNESGQVVEELLYYPYGLVRAHIGSEIAHYTFTGKEMDETGLYYYNTRYYDAVTGRFISVDPLYVLAPGGQLTEPRLQNTYLYALGNPPRYQDPTGNSPDDAITQTSDTLYLSTTKPWSENTDDARVTGSDVAGWSLDHLSGCAHVGTQLLTNQSDFPGSIDALKALGRLKGIASAASDAIDLVDISYKTARAGIEGGSESAYRELSGGIARLAGEKAIDFVLIGGGSLAGPWGTAAGYGASIVVKAKYGGQLESFGKTMFDIRMNELQKQNQLRYRFPQGAPRG